MRRYGAGMRLISVADHRRYALHAIRERYRATHPWSVSASRFSRATTTTPSFRDQTSQTRQEIFDWAAGRGQLMLVVLAASVAIAFILAFVGV